MGAGLAAGCKGSRWESFCSVLHNCIAKKLRFPQRNHKSKPDLLVWHGHLTG